MATFLPLSLFVASTQAVASSMQRRGLTMVELVVVIAIIGILVAVATPKLVTTGDATLESALKQDLRVLRDAIEAHAADHGGRLPGDQATEADFKADIAPYIRRFPENPFNHSDKVFIRSTGTTFAAVQSGGYGWLYDSKTGDVRANSGKLSVVDGVTRMIER